MESSEIVVGLGRLGLGRDDLLEGCSRLVQITALKKCHAIGEVVALKSAIREKSFERQSFLDSFRLVPGRRSNILLDLFGMHRPLIDLHDHAGSVDQERSRNRQISATTKEVTIDDVVDTRYF